MYHENILFTMVLMSGVICYGVQVGFLAESRRMNVAVTRARRQCCVVCDNETVGHNRFLQRIDEHFTERGELRSAMEYQT